MITRVALLCFGGLFSAILYSAGQREGWPGGLLMALTGIGIGLAAIIAVVVITVMKIRKKEERRGISAVFFVVSVGLLALGAAKMIK
ncbi:MAG: hypothetical protein HZA31_04340 [Opitutae bacterium]|nr:hypothetical protein [Opitutae bacterium]